MSPPIDGTELGALLGTFGRLEVLRLPKVGWLQVKHYPAYDGRNPITGEKISVAARRSPFFIAGWELGAEREFDNESDRFLAALHPDGDVEGEEPFVVVRSTLGDAVAEAVVAQLRQQQRCEVTGVGTFERFEKNGVQRLRFIAG